MCVRHLTNQRLPALARAVPVVGIDASIPTETLLPPWQIFSWLGTCSASLIMEVYYHVFANTAGSAIAKEQIARINCFIPDATIRCGVVVVDPESADELVEYLDQIPNVEIIARADAGNEWLTLSKLHQDCLTRWTRKQPILYCQIGRAHV